MASHIPFAAIFDMDGTLLKTEEIAVPAFQQTFEVLRAEGLFSGRMPSAGELTGVLGMTLEEIWNRLLPGQSGEIKHKADRLMLQKELEILKQGNVHLYPGVKPTLQQLKTRGISLFVASNGLDEYIRAVCDYFELGELFTDLYSAGRFQTESKDDLVAKLLRDFRIERAVMVGDRKSDIQAGRVNRLFTIGCGYGFAGQGELDLADVIVHRFVDILPVIEERMASSGTAGARNNPV